MGGPVKWAGFGRGHGEATNLVCWHVDSSAMWFVLLTFLFCASASQCQYVNESSFNCTPVDWSEVNTTNYTELDVIFEKCLEHVAEYEDCPDASLCDDTTSSDENLALAFGLTAAAGLATTLGSLVPFIPCIRRSDTKYLAVSLGLAAGVMLYVSFTEIFVKSQDQFCCVSVAHQNLLATSCFFVGILLTVALDVLVKLLQKVDCSCCKWKLSCHVPWKSRDVIVLRSSGGSSPNQPCNPMNAVSPLASNGGVVQFEEGVSVEHISTHVDIDGNNFAHLSSSNDDSPSLHNRAEFVHGDPDNDRMAYTPNIERASISAGSNTVSTTTNNLG